jgi:FixJ family two-component response regulator
MKNPWKLTPKEAEVMTALIDAGCVKVAAKAVGMSHRTAEHHLLNVRRQMEVTRTMLAVVMWDRHLRGNGG